MATQTLWFANDNLVVLEELKNVDVDEFLDDTANVRITLKTKAGVEVVGETWPLTMQYRTPDPNATPIIKDGTYAVILDKALELVKKAKYKAYVDFDDGAGLEGQYVIDFVCLERPAPVSA